MKPKLRKHGWLVSTLALLTLLSACGQQQPRTLQGSTMGTTWSVKLPGDVENSKALQIALEAELAVVNKQMSTYDPTSDLSRFNQSQSTDWQPVPIELAAVVAAAQQLAIISDGMFDATVGPLVNLWGFGPEHQRDDVPTAADIATTRLKTGYRQLQVRAKPSGMRKSLPELYVDLSAIAKGYGVDRLGSVLEAHGISDYLAEIGGELRARGVSARGTPWRIGIEKPVANQRVATNVIELNNKAIATSGDYRNYFEKNGERFSHTINPKTGKPITHKLASVSVIHPSTMLADGWATTLMSLGPEAGLALANAQKLSVLMLVKDGDSFIEKRSDLMQISAVPDS